ncbi:MAG: SMP-30/gluconolactonase/LRE family protein [Acidovorax sp.]|jgi:sugar lactone lactonase YvrE|nr:SMP-30/gluconolactonase/LRE family protein [Acidovorax sp.]MDR3003584.1 SMP-30/gluconolactonase/LRE family protein [Acidovorax sp.]
MNRVELVLDVRNATGESPVWQEAEQALYWADIPYGVLHRWQAERSQHMRWKLPQMLACMAPYQGDARRWIAGLEDGLYEVTLDEGYGSAFVQPLAKVEHPVPDMRFNDGRCDRQGRFIAGTMVMDMAAALPMGQVYRLGMPEQQTGQACNLQLGPLLTPNGLAFSPDGKTMYLSDSHPLSQTIWAFDYDTDTGTPSRRRVWVDMQPLPGRPDGAAMDVDGGYWICANDAGLVHRFTPDGKLDRSLSVPVKKPAMCAFGGRGLDTLFVTSIRPKGVDLTDQPLAGGVFALRPGVQGLAETAFREG